MNNSGYVTFIWVWADELRIRITFAKTVSIKDRYFLSFLRIAIKTEFLMSEQKIEMQFYLNI